MRYFNVILIFFICSSCSFIINFAEDKQVIKVLKNENEAGDQFCAEFEKTNFNILTSSIYLGETVEKLFLKEPFKRLKAVERFVLGNLLLMNTSPHIASPTSRFHFVYFDGNDFEYQDFFKSSGAKSKPWSTFHALDMILKRFNSPHSLYTLARMTKKIPQFKVEKDLALFFSENQETLQKVPNFKKAYFIGTDILKENETLPLIDYSKLVRNYNKAKNIWKEDIIENNHLFSYELKNGEKFTKTQCNFDLNLYDNSIFLISDNFRKSSFFGIEMGGKVLLGISSQRSNLSKEVEETQLFSSSGHTPPLGVCFIESKGNSFLISSLNGRDPGQHLYQLIQMNIDQSTTLREMEEYIEFPRHLFLVNPPRMVFESKENEEDNVNKYNSLGLPIYHLNNLGQVVSYGKFFSRNYKRSGFITDNRQHSYLSCKSKYRPKKNENPQ